jgi:Holliday junction DNA helicase RuvA
MFDYIEGKLVEKMPTHAVIDCAGVGYFINISLYTYTNIGSSERCKLYVHQAIREDALVQHE